MEKILEELAGDYELLARLRQQGMSYVRERFTWDAKAKVITRITEWAAGRGPKPDLPPPEIIGRNYKLPRKDQVPASV
jgi:hypothetical protein